MSVNRVARQVPDQQLNRTVGMFVPTKGIQARDSSRNAGTYASSDERLQGRQSSAPPEAKYSILRPQNLDALASVRSSFRMDLKVAPAVQKTRGESRRQHEFNLNFGNEKSLKGSTTARRLPSGSLMMRHRIKKVSPGNSGPTRQTEFVAQRRQRGRQSFGCPAIQAGPPSTRSSN